jgi:hypothetical protein
MRWHATLMAGWVCAACACSAWSPDAKLREGGPNPYVRCLAGAPPRERTGRAGDISFAVKGQSLTLTAQRLPLRVAAFSGAGFGALLSGTDLARLQQLEPDLIVVLGGLGEREASVETNARALAKLGRLVVFVAGGRDRSSVIRPALAALGHDSNLVDATTLHRISIENNTFIPVAGADQGRYAIDEDACGFAGTDLEALSKDLGTAQGGERRWLLSWNAPADSDSSSGPVHTETGVDIGSDLLGTFRERVGALGVLSAWPVARAEVRAVGPLNERIVPRLFGPRLERSDGAQVEAGVLALELDRQGLRVTGLR